MMLPKKYSHFQSIWNPLQLIRKRRESFTTQSRRNTRPNDNQTRNKTGNVFRNYCKKSHLLKDYWFRKKKEHRVKKGTISNIFEKKL